jgi:hypothetical protein
MAFWCLRTTQLDFLLETRPVPSDQQSELGNAPHNKVIRKVRRVEGENGQFRHNIKHELGMKFYKTK